MANRPGPKDYINIHDHGALTTEGVFIVDNIMVHQGRSPSENRGIAFSVGAHPWNIDLLNLESQMSIVRDFSLHPNVIAIGESGFDKIKGESMELQKEAFIMHSEISEERGKPLVIHCVKAFDEVLAAKREIKPHMPWIMHGFRGSPELARQLTGKGIYLSAWVEWAIRPVSAETLRAIPREMLFLETDGFDISIIPVYQVVAGHLGVEVPVLREQVHGNFLRVFG